MTTRRRFHPLTLSAGVFFLLMGVVFLLEAFEVWTAQVSDLQVLGPALLVAVGLLVILGATVDSRRPRSLEDAEDAEG
jgi:hypothetical protein